MTHHSEGSDPAPQPDEMHGASFKITFECASALRVLADVFDSMLDTVDIQVLNTPTFSGIMIEAMDTKQISLVVAQLQADVTMDCERTAFCVNTKTLQTVVKSAQPHFSIDISSVPGSSSVRLVAYESLSNSTVTRFTLPTLVCDEERSTLQDIDYKFHIDMETAVLKQIVRMVLLLGGDSLTFRVQQLCHGHDEKRTKSSKSKHTILTLSSGGNGHACDQEHTFYSLTEERDGASMMGTQTEIKNVPVDEDLETKYEEVFGAKHLQEFLKSIDRHTVTLRLDTGHPLIINHKLGVEDSFVCLAVAPQVVDE